MIDYMCQNCPFTATHYSLLFIAATELLPATATVYYRLCYQLVYAQPITKAIFKTRIEYAPPTTPAVAALGLQL